MIWKFLFPIASKEALMPIMLLIIRIVFGGLFMSHGVQKLLHFKELSAAFPDPIGVGSKLALSLAIFAELFCSLGFISGFLYRLALIPMIFTMLMVVFVVMSGKPFASIELAVLYLSIFIIMYIFGPGKYSIDYLIGTYCAR